MALLVTIYSTFCASCAIQYTIHAMSTNRSTFYFTVHATYTNQFTFCKMHITIPTYFISNDRGKGDPLQLCHTCRFVLGATGKAGQSSTIPSQAGQLNDQPTAAERPTADHSQSPATKQPTCSQRQPTNGRKLISASHAEAQPPKDGQPPQANHP